MTGNAFQACESAHTEPGVWHDRFNAAALDAIVRAEVTPGERFGHRIETLFGLAREGHVNGKGMPNLLQLALTAQEFSDLIVFRKPPQPRCAPHTCHERLAHDGRGTLISSMPWDDDDDWVGEPPEGRYTRDRAKPEFWRQPWPWAGAGFALLLVIVVVVLIVK